MPNPRIFNVPNMSYNAIRENKVLAKNSESTVFDVCLWLHPPWLNWEFNLALTVYELEVILFVSSQYVDWFDCFPMMMNWTS